MGLAHKIVCGTGYVIEAPEEVAEGQAVYVITHTHRQGSLWGWHLEHMGSDGARRSQVVAFARKPDAERMAQMLWVHRLKRHEWPRTARDSPELELAFADDVLLTSASPLTIDEVQLPWLVGHVGKSCMAVLLVDPLEENEGALYIRGKYCEMRSSPRDQAKWLKMMWDRPAKRQTE